MERLAYVVKFFYHFSFQDPKQYVNEILAVHKRYDQLVSKSFCSDAGFVQAMDRAFTCFINKNRITDLAKTPAKSPELLARCCDLLLRKSAKNPEESELEEYLTQIVSQILYILIVLDGRIQIPGRQGRFPKILFQILGQTVGWRVEQLR